MGVEGYGQASSCVFSLEPNMRYIDFFLAGGGGKVRFAQVRFERSIPFCKSFSYDQAVQVTGKGLCLHQELKWLVLLGGMIVLSCKDR